uniref:Dehydrin ERD10 n=1 Tax=Noccaea caerulescens TaxID=107243 RepID=A0A1J3GQJ8_NOCCA
MAEEYKNASEDFKNVPEHETPKNATTEEPSETTGEVKSRGMFDFLKKKEEVKPQETTTTTTTPLESEFEQKTQISEPEPFVAKHEVEEEKEQKPTLLEKLHQKHEAEEENKPGLLEKLHGSNSSSSSEEEGEDGEKRKKNKERKKIIEEDKKTEEKMQEDRKGLMEQIKEKFPHGSKTEGGEVIVTTAPPVTAEPELEHPAEKKGVGEKIKEKLPGHSKKPEDSPIVNTTAAVPVPEEETAEKKGFLEKIKEKLPGHNAKSTAEEEKKSDY